jgi:hypothetical protein
MKDQNEMLTASIDDYLVSLGDSLHKAQRQLSQMATTLQPGEPPITYHVPRLEFEFRISFELSQEPTAAQPGSAPGQVRIRPVSGQRTDAQHSSTEAASTIKGSFIAVPVRGGKPPPVLRSTLNRRPGRMLEVKLEVQSAAGERLSGVEVQFNIDPEVSRALTEAQAGRFSLAPQTGFIHGKARTDTHGIAVNVLRVDPQQAAGVYLMLTMDAAGVTEKVLYQVP